MLSQLQVGHNILNAEKSNENEDLHVQTLSPKTTVSFTINGHEMLTNNYA